MTLAGAIRVVEGIIRQSSQRVLARHKGALRALVAQAEARIGGPKPKHVDLERVEELARLGMRELGTIARVMGHHPDLFRKPDHRADVQEAIARGRALWEQEALAQYEGALKHDKVLGQKMPMLIFKMKQCGWTDRQQVTTGAPTVDLSGARERLMALVAKYRSAAA